MIKEFCLPDLGEGLTSARITEWHVTEGQNLIIDQPLCSVETTKSIVEIPVPYAGKLVKFSAAAGSNIATGACLCTIELKRKPIMAKARQNVNKATQNIPGYSTEGLSPHQIAMFNKLILAQTQVVNASLSEYVTINSKVSTAMLCWAMAQTLSQHKLFNASYHKNSGLKYHDNIDIGLAVQGPDGLFIAEITNANNLKINDIAEKIKQLKSNPGQSETTNKARMTLSNIGSTGAGVFSTPSIMLPGLATLAVGRSLVQPEWQPDSQSWLPITVIPLSLSFDHRFITGANSAEFIKTFSRFVATKTEA